MAERDFELLDDYLANRMSQENRFAFEQRLQGDPSLQSEFELQNQVVQAIRQARVAELKSMLNNVPIPAQGTGMGSKIGVAAAVTAIVAGAWWFINLDETPPPARPEVAAVEPVTVPEAPEQTATGAEAQTEPITTTPEPAPQVREETPREPQQSAQPTTDKNQTSAGTEQSRPWLAQKPIAPPGPAPKRSTPPVLATVVAGENAENNFHYRFAEGKLYLHGPFDSAQYRLVHVTLDQKAVPVLAHKDKYYLLLRADGEIHPLEPVTDSVQVEKINTAINAQ